MQRPTLIDQVITDALDECVDTNRIETFCSTMTTRSEMKQLAIEHGFRAGCHRHQFQLTKFVPYIDESGEEDAEMIEHDFYF